MSKIDPIEKELFFQALELEDSSQISDFLEKNCSGDPDRKQRLQNLLLHHETDDRILDQTVVHLPSVAAQGFQEPNPGDIIGHYRLVEKIGEGGMGLVYRARSEQHNREVALKVIKLGMDTKRVVARFQAESQSLSMMNHPAITRILEAGSTAEGRPYFVMELVDGKPIHQFCYDEDLDLNERIALFVQVCQGVQHAHQKGIIHRDLKPSNVLVQKQDQESSARVAAPQDQSEEQTATFSNPNTPLPNIQPKIIDFGIAKAVDQRIGVDTFLTGHGEFLGTPAFMSPEQASGDQSQVDTRSDVYALGALLYRIIAGSSPFQFQGMGMTEIQRHISEVLPTIPSAQARKLSGKKENYKGIDPRLVAGDLDWVIMKCLSKNPSDRYNSPKELIDDLERFTSGDPVEAAAPSRIYHLKKFAAKNIGLMVSSAAIVLLLIAGWIITSVYAYRTQQLAKRAINAEQQATRNFKEAEDARKEAERERDKARRAEAILQDLVREKRMQTAFYRTLLNSDPDVQIQSETVMAAKSVPATRLRPTATISSEKIQEKGTIVARFGNEKVTLPFRRIVVPAMKAESVAVSDMMKIQPPSNHHQINIPFLERLLKEQRKEFGAGDPEIKETLRLLAQSYLEAEKLSEATDKLCECYEIAKDTDWLRKDKDSIGAQYAEAITGSEKVKECRSVLEKVKTRIETEGPKAVKLKQAIDQVLKKLEKDTTKESKPARISPNKNQPTK